jgi:hypothetical protein
MRVIEQAKSVFFERMYQVANTIPIWIQRPLFGLLAVVGRALGYKASYNAQPA